jgi:hypothetical protein
LIWQRAVEFGLQTPLRFRQVSIALPGRRGNVGGLMAGREKAVLAAKADEVSATRPARSAATLRG